MKRFFVGTWYLLAFCCFLLVMKTVFASSLNSVIGGGGTTIDSTAISGESAKSVEPLIVEGEFSTGCGSTVEITLNGDISANEADINFRTTGFEVFPENVNIDALQATDDKISFSVTGAGKITFSNIQLYTASGSTIATERLKVTLDGASQTGDNFTVDTFPVYTDGSGSFEGKTGGDYFRFGDLLSYIPPENEGETFTIDLTALGLSSTWPAETALSLPEGYDLEATTFPVTIHFDGGFTRTIQSPPVSIDTQLPEPETTQVLNIKGDKTVAVIDDVIQLTPPTDTHGDPVFFDVDLSLVGGGGAVFENQNQTVETTIRPGSHNNSDYSTTVILYDKAQNSASFQTNPIKVDNTKPFLDPECGGRFEIIDNGDDNHIADITNNEADRVIFYAPDGTQPNCDIARFSVDLSPISSLHKDNINQHSAMGQKYYLTVRPGTLDSEAMTFLMTITDENGNINYFNTQPLNIDNQIADPEEIFTDEGALSFSSPDEELMPGDRLSVYVKTVERDITIVAQILGATDPVILTSDPDNPNVYTGILAIKAGNSTRNFLRVKYSITDDAGNYLRIFGKESWFITNDIEIKYGGGGGTGNLHRSDGGSLSEVNRTVVRRQIKLDKAMRQKLAEEIAKQAEADEEETFELLEEEVPELNDYLQSFQDKFDELEKEKIQEDLETLPSYKEPEFLENKIRSLGFRNITSSEWERYKDDEGGLRLQNTLHKLKRRKPKKIEKNTVPGTLRITELANRGKYGKIRYPNDHFTVMDE